MGNLCLSKGARNKGAPQVEAEQDSQLLCRPQPRTPPSGQRGQRMQGNSEGEPVRKKCSIRKSKQHTFSFECHTSSVGPVSNRARYSLTSLLSPSGTSTCIHSTCRSKLRRKSPQRTNQGQRKKLGRLRQSGTGLLRFLQTRNTFQFT